MLPSYKYSQYSCMFDHNPDQTARTRYIYQKSNLVTLSYLTSTSQIIVGLVAYQIFKSTIG